MFLPDTNVLIDCGNNPAVQMKLDSAERSGATFVIAPSTIIELTVGVVRGGAPCFQKNRRIFNWLQAHSGAILDLPRPFVSKKLGFAFKMSQVEPLHYVQCIGLVVNSLTFDEFLSRKDDAESLWRDVDRAFQIHNDQVDKEFTAWEQLAALPKEKVDVAKALCKGVAPAGVDPDLKLFKQYFSAAVEYVEASIAIIRQAASVTTTRTKANPRKNDRGRYGDFQMFFYLADPDMVLLTGEKKKFLRDVRHSPQRDRILDIDAL